MENQLSEINQEIAVSICCITYNHENYIRQALESFVNQRTNFKYEVLIHDDASTDKTADIIREYKRNYPDLIKPIYQMENQHSKGIKVGLYNTSRVKGKYVAVCEGDDFWTDEYKLQKQYDFMESHPDFSMCCHAASLVDIDGKYVGFGGLFLESGELMAPHVICEVSGWIKTASIFYRAQYCNNRPDFFYNLPVGDYPLRLYLFSQGRIWYDSSVMSAYRISIGKKVNTSSYVYKMSKTKGMRRKERESMNSFLEKYNEYTEEKYKDSILKRIDLNNYLIYVDEKNLKQMLKNNYFKELPAKSKFEGLLQVLCIPAYNAEQNIKRHVKNIIGFK